MASPNEAAGLKAISSIRYKIATASTNEKQLSDVLQTQLVPLLDKAGSPVKAVRDAAFQAYISVTKLIQPPGVVLPVASLLRQYKTTVSPVVKQLDLGLVKKGLPRLDQAGRWELVPTVVHSISKEASLSNASGLFVLFLRLMVELQVPPKGSKEDESFRMELGLSDSGDAGYVAQWLGKLFLLRQDQAAATDLGPNGPPPGFGLERSAVEFLRGGDSKTWNIGEIGSLNLPECKLKALSLLSSGAFTDQERFLPAICASGSTDYRVNAIAEDILKRTDVDLEEEGVVSSLYRLHNELPVPHRIQILKLLSKSTRACSLGEQVVQVVQVDFELTSGESPAISGLEALRLHKALLGFLASVARHRPDLGSGATDIGPSLVLLLKDYILMQGWPHPRVNANQSQLQDEQRLRANAYEIIGTLSKSSRFERNVREPLLKWLLDSLVSDSCPDIFLSIEGALSSMMGLFQPTDELGQRDLEILLLEYMDTPEIHALRTAKHVATRFANNCLPYSNVKARWIDILALSGGPLERRDVLEEGQRGLDPWWAVRLHPEDKLQLPSWTNLVDAYFDPSPYDAGDNEMAVDQRSSYSMFPDSRLSAFPVAVKYITQMMFLTALKDDKLEVDWESRMYTKVHNDLQIRRSLQEHFAVATPDALQSASKFLGAILDGLKDHPDIGAEECAQSAADLVTFMPTSVVVMLSARSAELVPLLRSNNQNVRQLAAKIFGIVAPWDPQALPLLSRMRDFLVANPTPLAAQSAEYQGCLRSLGHFIPQAVLHEKVDAEFAADLSRYLFQRCTNMIKLSDSSIQDTAMEVLSQILTLGLGFPTDPREFDETATILTKLAKSNNETAINALGRLTISEKATSQQTQAILDVLAGLHEIKRTEIHFASGEAIAAATARWQSQAVQLSLGLQLSDSTRTRFAARLTKRPDQLVRTIERIIEDCKTTKPALLKASGIWLFSMIQYCSDLVEVQSRLRQCQVAFTRLLAARDELVQETASRGLSLVYERGDDNLKADLVKDLVATFTGSKTQLQVEDDTELFDANALPTGEGKSVTSYRDIISLANEVGDQSLIYKFMALATNAATWTARSAFGRFGLSNVLSEAELDPKIYPKLYRYRFDPNSNVRRSMDDIWKAIVKDSAALIDERFDALMDDLLKSIVDGREWRVREASCSAIGDLTYGQPFSKYEKYYTDIWRAALRVMDDQKGSVRAAALKMCLGLSKTLITQLKENNGSMSAKAMISQVLPFLLSEKGIESSVDEVKYMAITTILDVVKNGGDTLKPFIPGIIVHFLGLLGTVEPQAIGYYYQRAEEKDREELDRMRSNAATRSPIFECIGDSLRFVDFAVMRELAPQLLQTVKTAIHMQTKVGCSEVFATLALRHSILLGEYSAQFLKAMEGQILDRNFEVSKAYSRSSAFLLRTASSETRERFTLRLLELYFTADEDSRRQKVADTVLAISKVSPDVFTDLEFRLLPFAFLAKNDTDDYVSEEFTAVWDQHAGGNHTVLRYVDETVELVLKALETSRWALQHGGALAMASMITSLEKVVGKDGQFGDTSSRRIWPPLERTLLLKTFTGKEKLITAFPIFVSHSQGFWSAEAGVAAQMTKIAIREAKRNNEEYRPFAFNALAEFAKHREDLDIYDESVSLVSDFLAQDKSSGSITDREQRTIAAALEVVMTAYPLKKLQAEPAAMLDRVISNVEKHRAVVLIARETWHECTMSVLERAPGQPTPAGTEEESTAMRWLNLLTSSEEGSVIESQRSGRAKAINALIQARARGVFGAARKQDNFETETGRRLQTMLQNERSLDVRKLLKDAAQKL